MLRITALQEDERRAFLRLEGRIVGPWVGELARHCDLALRSARETTLDMRGVTFVDADGLRLVGRLIQGGIRLTGCSAFVTDQIRGGCDAPNATG